ncbi:MAG: GNAT family N-acetyltransferase [Firmicutes bacterium]|nr:GNAT family N-acetyltransferase [Bacillota bacterium]
MEIRQITDPEKKAKICETILRALPDWFGVESSLMEYVAGVGDKPFFAAFDGNPKSDEAIGFAAIKRHSFYTAEVYVMGVLAPYHRQGIGRALIAECEGYWRDQDGEFLTVKTVDESGGYEEYHRTLKFYLAMGFRPLEVFPTLWDKCNPCLMLGKYISQGTD